MLGIWEGILKQRESSCNSTGGVCHGGVVDTGGEISPPLYNSWRGRFDLLFSLWSLTVHFIHQVSFEAGLEGFAFPPSWVWDALGHLPPHYLDQSCRGDCWWWTNPVGSVCAHIRLLKPSWASISGIKLHGDVWECLKQTFVHPCAAHSCQGQTLTRII